MLYEHGEPHGIRDDAGLICLFNPVTKFPGQEERYRKELQDRTEIADFLWKALHEADRKAVATQEVRTTEDLTATELLDIASSLAEKHEAERVDGLRKAVELLNKPDPAFSKVESDIRQLYADFQQGVASGRKEEWVAWEFAKDVVRVLSQPENRSSVPAPAINAAARERWFRESLNRLLEEHGAAIEVISDGGHLPTSLIQVTMNGEWDGEHNQVRQFAQFVL